MSKNEEEDSGFDSSGDESEFDDLEEPKERKVGKKQKQIERETEGNEEQEGEPEREVKRVKKELVLSYAEGLDKTCDYILGIDEAGRGPVLGHMVYAIAFYPTSKKTNLIKIGFNDSKKLTERRRDELFDKMIPNSVGYFVDPLSPQLLSSDMLRVTQRNLNKISFDSAIGLIQRVVDLGIKINTIFVDTVGPPESYEKLLRTNFPRVPKIVVAKKADSKYPIVGAASICAKVVRDRLLLDWQFEEKIEFTREFGSGYPSDPATKSWLVETFEPIFGYPTIVRFSWKTTTKLINKRGIEVFWSNDDSQHVETSTPKKTSSLAVERTKVKTKALDQLAKRSTFFTCSNMRRVTNF